MSDLLNEIAAFVNDNPNWFEDSNSVAKLAIAYTVLRSISSPDMVTAEEYEFIMDIHNHIEEMSE